MHKEIKAFDDISIINGGVDLLPDLKRFMCTLVPLNASTVAGMIFAYAYDAVEAHSKAVAYFQKSLGPSTPIQSMFKVEVVEAPGDTK